MKTLTSAFCALLLAFGTLPALADDWRDRDRRGWRGHDRHPGPEWRDHRSHRGEGHRRHHEADRWSIHIDLGGRAGPRHWDRRSWTTRPVLIHPGARAWTPAPARRHRRGREVMTRCYERRLDHRGREVRIYLEPWRCR